MVSFCNRRCLPIADGNNDGGGGVANDGNMSIHLILVMVMATD